MATSKRIKWSDDLDDDISKSAPKLLVTGDPEFMFYQTRVKIQDHFKNIQKSAQELESKLLNELDEYAEMHCNMLLETNSVIEQMTAMLNTLTDTQIKKNLNKHIDLLNKQKYINIVVKVEEKLSDYMNKTISINIEMVSDTNLEKVRSSNPHPVMLYRKTVNIDTFHEQVNEIKSLSVKPKYLKQGKMWYLIGRKWIEQFMNYRQIINSMQFYGKNLKFVNGLIPIPPPIDNSDIMDETESHGLLKYPRKYNTIHLHKNNECITEELVMGRDFVIFNEAAWGKLVELYGIKEGTVILPRRVASILPCDNSDSKMSVDNISLCLYPNYANARFMLFTSYYNFRYTTSYLNKEIRFFEHDTELDKLTAVKRVLGIPLSSEIIIFREENSGTRIYPNTNKKYTVESIVPSSISNSYFGCRDVPIYLVAVKSKETEWLYV